MTAAPSVAPAVTPSSELIARAGTEDATRRVRGCTRPVRLCGSTTVVRRSTGELVRRYSSADELDGRTYLRCGNRRAAVCPSCSHEYKGDAWHLLVCGLAGGKGIPDTVAGHPAVFLTLTAPSFGPVHGLRGKGPCRARRDRPVCPHGRPAWCNARHTDGDPRLGLPLCSDCYDYAAHVVWQWWAPELWRRFTIALTRALSASAGLTPAQLRHVARVNYTKVVEFQARGVIHVHAVVRLDGPSGADDPAPAALPASVVESAVHRAAGRVRLLVPLPGGERLALRWGAQVDTRPVDGQAGRDNAGGPAHPRQVAAYLAKYLTKTTEDFGLPGRVLSAGHAAATGATPHAIRLIATAERLAAASPVYALLATRLGTLGYRGHPITKSRAYSVTFGALRRARRHHRRQPAAGLAPNAAVRELPGDDDPDAAADLLVLSEWTFEGVGYLTTDRAALAMASAARARAHRWATAGV